MGDDDFQARRKDSRRGDLPPPNIPEEAERNIERKQAHDKLRDELLKAAKGLGKR